MKKFWAIRNKTTGLFFPECKPSSKTFYRKNPNPSQVNNISKQVYGWTHRDVNVDLTNDNHKWPHRFESRNEAGRVLEMWLRGQCLNNNAISRDPHDPNCGKRWIKDPNRKAEDMEIVEMKVEMA